MPHPIYYMNPPPNPFWDFVAGMEDHPFFRGAPRPPFNYSGPHPAPPAPPAAPGPELSETAQGKQPNVEDPPEVDPTTVKPTANEDISNNFPFRGRGRFSQAFDNDDESARGRGGNHCRGRGRRGFRGPPPFMTGHPFWSHPGWTPPHGHEHRGPPGPPHHHGPPPHHHGPPPPGPHHHHGPRRGPSPHSPKSFDLSQFLNRLGDKLGIDLSNAAEGLGLTADRFTAGKPSTEIDFEPRTDIFENPNLYTIHLSLPGAKKSDIGVDYDGENSVLRIAGVVHRPDIDEQSLAELQVDGRKRETGVFEKAIRLGTKRDPASIDVAGISAKMTDGVLVVKIPKVEVVHPKREVPITADVEEADYEDEYSEKPVLFDAEEGSETTEIYAGKKEGHLIDMKDHEKVEPEGEKFDEKTVEEKEVKGKTDQLPAYAADEHEEDDWEKFSDASADAEYIKINVD